MSQSTMRTAARQPRREQATHRFEVGQLVRLKGFYMLPSKWDEPHRITATLPVRDNTFQYRVRNEAEKHERVVMEDGLEALSEDVDAASGGAAQKPASGS